MTTALRRPVPALALALVSVVVLLAGCSSGTPEAEPTPAADDTGADPAPQVIGGEPAGNGLSGLIAAVSDSLMQVQETDSQTAVTWTDETVVTRTVVVGLDAIAVGSCVLAMAPAAEEGEAATAVTVSEPVDGECAAGFGAFRGPEGAAPGDLPDDFEPPDGMPLPEGMPTPEGGQPPQDGERPEGMTGAFGQIVVGSVTAVSGSTLTVETTDADGATSTETVETGADTVVTTTVDAAATDIAVGLCASVRGEPDTRGGMTATTIALSDAGENGCTVGMGGLRPTNQAGDE